MHWTSVVAGKGWGQAKPVERAFGVGGLEEYVDKHPALAGAYTGIRRQNLITMATALLMQSCFKNPCRRCGDVQCQNRP